MDFLRLRVELEGADVEIDFVIRSRRRAVDPTGEPRVLETLGQPRAKQRRQRLRPASAGERGQRLRFAYEDVIAVEIGRRGRLADTKLRSDRVGRRRACGGEIIQGRRGSARARREREKARSGKCSIDARNPPPLRPIIARRDTQATRVSTRRGPDLDYFRVIAPPGQCPRQRASPRRRAPRIRASPYW